MARYNDTLRDQYQRPIAGALVSVADSATGALAALTADSGAVLTNPLTTGQDGLITFNVPAGLYDFAYRIGGRLAREDANVPLGDVSSLPAGSVVDFLGSSTSLAPSQRAVQAGLDAKANLTAVTPLLPLTSTAARTFTGRTDGTDVSALLLAASTAGPVILPPGVYTIGTSITLPNVISFAPGARLAIANGVTVTFSSPPDAPEGQIFNLTGTGAVAGLAEAKQAWFDGDLATLPGLPTSTTTCDAALQAAFNAVQIGILYGDYRTRRKGSAVISMGNAVYDGRGANYLWATTTTNLFSLDPSTAQVAPCKNFSVGPLVVGTIPTAGTAIVVNRSGVSYEGAVLNRPFNGIDCVGGVSNTYRNFQVVDALNFGVRVKSDDQYFEDFSIQALNDLIVLSSITGTFSAGDALTVGGSLANIVSKIDATHFTVFVNDVQPAAGMSVTNTTSGGSATIASVSIGHQVGGFRTEGNAEAMSLQAGEVLGGLLSLTVASYSGAAGRAGNLAYSRFMSDVYFDTSYQGAQIQGAYGTRFECWFSNSRGKDRYGAYFTLCSECDVRAHFVANSAYGGLVDAYCVGMDFSFSRFDGNTRNYTTSSGLAELAFAGAIQRLTVTNIKIGFPGTNGITPVAAIRTDAAASDYLKFGFIQAPAGSITWASTGTHNRRVAVDGLADL